MALCFGNMTHNSSIIQTYINICACVLCLCTSTHPVLDMHTHTHTTQFACVCTHTIATKYLNTQKGIFQYIQCDMDKPTQNV